MNMFNSITGLVIGAISLLICPVAANAETYKIRISGGGNAWWTGAANSYAVISIFDGPIVTIKQTTLVSNMITGLGKWWDHPVTASRACPFENGEWESTENCIIGVGGRIQLPADSLPTSYSYEFRWNENGSTQRAVVDIRKAVPERSR
jgi:hypothetical protein